MLFETLFLVSGCTLYLYCATLYASIPGGDSGELVAEAVPEHQHSIPGARNQEVLVEADAGDFGTVVALHADLHAVEPVVGVVDVEDLSGYL